MKYLLVDSLVANELSAKAGAAEAWAAMKQAIADGDRLFFTEASWIDNRAVQYAYEEDEVVLEEYLKRGDIIIHIYQGKPHDAASGFAAMVSKPFYHSSVDVTTNLESGTFLDILPQLPEQSRNAYEGIYNLALQYAQAKSEWTMGPWEPVKEFTDEELQKLGLTEKEAGNRTRVREAILNSDFTEERWAKYLVDYNHKFVVQHGCDGVWGVDLLTK